MSVQERAHVRHGHMTIFVFIQKHEASTHTPKFIPNPLPSNTDRSMSHYMHEENIFIHYYICHLIRDNFHLRFCSITSRSGAEIALSVSCSWKASDWLSSSDVILSFLKNSVWVTKPFPSSSYLWKKEFVVFFTADIRHLTFLNACQVYSCAHKFTWLFQNMQNVNHFIKIRGSWKLHVVVI